MMLLYNKSLDVNHTVLRISSILIHTNIETIEIERLRIFDFIVSNPVHISKMSLGADLLKEKNKFRDYRNRYQNFEPKSLFESMRPIQEIVIANFKELGSLVQIEESFRLKIAANLIPEELIALAKSDENSISKQTLDFINAHLLDLNLTGKKGLKYASNLMEYRYDAS
jgi:hypothetical protein